MSSGSETDHCATLLVVVFIECRPRDESRDGGSGSGRLIGGSLESSPTPVPNATKSTARCAENEIAEVIIYTLNAIVRRLADAGLWGRNVTKQESSPQPAWSMMLSLVLLFGPGSGRSPWDVNTVIWRNA